MDTRPELPPWLHEYLAAFFVLHESRPTGFSVGAIPLSEMLAFCQIHEMDDVPRFCRLIRGLDQTFLEWNREQQKHKTKTK